MVTVVHASWYMYKWCFHIPELYGVVCRSWWVNHFVWKLSWKTFLFTSYPRVPTFHDEFEWDYEVTPSLLFIKPSSPALRSIQTIIITSTTHNLLYLTLLRPIKSCRWQNAIVERLHRIAHSTTETIQTYSWTFSANVRTVSTSILSSVNFFHATAFPDIGAVTNSGSKKYVLCTDMMNWHTHTHTSSSSIAWLCRRHGS